MQFKILDKVSLVHGVLVVLEGAFDKINTQDVLIDDSGHQWLVCGKKYPNIEQYKNGHQVFLIRHDEFNVLDSDFMTAQNLPNQKQDTLQNKFIDTALSPSEILSLRQDLKDAYKQGKGYFKKRAKRLKVDRGA